MSDPVERMLEGLKADPSRPAPAFLRAVARRRHRRQFTRAAGAAALLLLVGARLWRFSPSPAPLAPVVRSGRPPAFSLREVSLAALTRANVDAGSLSLPEPEGSGPAMEVRPGMRSDVLDRLLSR